MNLEEIAQSLELELLTDMTDLNAMQATGGYASDMLSCVMSSATRQAVWVTLQAHVNIVAVAALLELSAIIITEHAPLDPAAILKANEKGVTIFSTPKSTFEVVGKLWEMGLRAN